MDDIRHCGYVALIGRPNSGKSTLLNYLVGEKIAAVSSKPQTTRTQLRGIITLPKGQIVFVDTPGVHKPGYKLNRRMMHSVVEALRNVDLIMLIRDVTAKNGQGERYVLEMVKQSGRPAFLLLNKIDMLKQRSLLLPLIDWYRQGYEFLEVVPISGLKGDGTDLLIDLAFKHLPEGELIFAEDALTDTGLRTIAAEMVREKILQSTEEEIPFATAVVCEKWDESDKLVKIYCAIYVERESQRAIILGRGGRKIRQIGTAARYEIERLVGKRVYLELFVKVHEDWRDDETALDALGIEEGRRS